jgi:hypothetical protein
MYVTDAIFAFIVLVLIALPLLSVYPTFDKFPYELFYLALGSVSVVALAWDRIASSRASQLGQLMNRVYLDGEIKLHETLDAICDRVRIGTGVLTDSQRNLERSILVLTRSGCFRGLDYLYPREAMADLRALSGWIDKYQKDFEEWETHVKQFEKEHSHPDSRQLRGLLKGQLELREEHGYYVPYLAGSSSKAEGMGALQGDLGKAMIDLSKKLEKESRWARRRNDGTWKREILERGSRIRDSFVQFIEKRGMERPPGSDKDWIQGGVVTDYSG